MESPTVSFLQYERAIALLAGQNDMVRALMQERDAVRWQSDEMRKLLVECYHALDGARSDDEVGALRDKLSLIKWDTEERDASQKGAE